MEANSDMGRNLKEEDTFKDRESKRISSWAKNKKRNWNVKLFRIHLLGHCIICLRPTTNSEEDVKTNVDSIELLEQVPKAELSSSLSTNLLTTLNRLWPYLQTSNGNKKGHKNGMDERITRFNRLPRLCLFCAEKLKAVDKLWRELSVQIEVLRSTLMQSKCGGQYSWRAENFEKAMMNSELDTSSIQAVLEFLQIIEIAPVSVAEAEPEAGDETELTEGNQEDEEFYSCMESPTTEYLSPSSGWSYDNVSDNISNHSTSDVDCQSVVEAKPISPAPVKRLSRQDSIEVPTPKPPVCQQSSDIFTSRENEMSFDTGEAEEGELADDESDPEYIKLEYEGLSSSDSDTSDDEDESIAASSGEEEPASLVAYQNLDRVSSGSGFGVYRHFSGSYGDLTGKG